MLVVGPAPREWTKIAHRPLWIGRYLALPGRRFGERATGFQRDLALA